MKQYPYLANPDEPVTYFDTPYAKNIPYVNIGTEENPYYLPQEMFRITDKDRKYISETFKKYVGQYDPRNKSLADEINDLEKQIEDKVNDLESEVEYWKEKYKDLENEDFKKD